MTDIFSTPIVQKGIKSIVLRRKSLHNESAEFRVAPVILDKNQVVKDASKLCSSRLDSFLEVTKQGNVSNLTFAGIGDLNYGLESANHLFLDFLDSCSRERAQGITYTLDQIAEFEQLVGDQVASLKAMLSNIPWETDKCNTVVMILCMLIDERNTWRLLGKLFHDRFGPSFSFVEKDDETNNNLSSDAVQRAGGSEKVIVEQLFRKNSKLREAQTIVDWLEANGLDTLNDMYTRIEHLADSNIAWENTLNELKSGSKNPRIVDNLDPDAPLRQGKCLHDIDSRDQAAVLEFIFFCIRAGDLERAQECCIQIGQPWRAATLEGWRLYHDPNYENQPIDSVVPAEGNPKRDIWRRSAWKLTTDLRVPVIERTIYAAFCGNLDALLNGCKLWEDYLWAHVRCMVDVLVETALRETLHKQFAELPRKYWENPRTLEQVMDAVSAIDNAQLQQDAQLPYHVIQKHIICGSYSQLIRKMREWSANCGESDCHPHLLRLMAHLVIVFRQILSPDMETVACNAILEAYVCHLMSIDQIAQVAWYTAQLPVERQVSLYASFLQSVNVDEDRRLCLRLAEENGLPVAEITVRVVELVRNIGVSSQEAQEILIPSTTERDRAMVDALAWLCYSIEQRSDAVYQANAMLRSFIASGKYEAAQLAVSALPSDTVDVIVEQFGGDECDFLREFICHRLFLEAHSSFTDWFVHFHKGKPVAPILPTKASFTELVAYEEKEKQYQRELERWNSAQQVQSRTASELIRSVIAFPLGWLVDQNVQQIPVDNETEESISVQRRSELDYLRKTCIPQLVLLLHSVLHSTCQFGQAIRLADLVASEHNGIYQVYSVDKMREFLSKIRESSLAALQTGAYDAWGFKKE